jgi:hypothetical protein
MSDPKSGNADSSESGIPDWGSKKGNGFRGVRHAQIQEYNWRDDLQGGEV